MGLRMVSDVGGDDAGAVRGSVVAAGGGGGVALEGQRRGRGVYL